MKINTDNYEQFLIDHMDGRLDTSLLPELKEFLDANPDIKEEFKDLELVTTQTDENIVFENKSQFLRKEIKPFKEINESNFEDYLIAFSENDLSVSEKRDVEEFTALNSHLQNDLNLFHIAHATPDLTINYNTKSALKKKPLFVRKSIYQTIGIAASIVILIGLFSVFRTNQNIIPGEQREEVPALMSRLDVFLTPAVNDQGLHSRNTIFVIKYADAYPPIEPLKLMASIGIPVKNYLSPKILTSPQITSLIPRDEYTQLVKELMINEELLLASFGDPNPKTFEKLTKTSWNKSIGKRSKSKRNKETSSDANKKGRINLWTFASMGIESFNLFTGSNVNIKRRLNEEGTKTKYSLVNGNVTSGSPGAPK